MWSLLSLRHQVFAIGGCSIIVAWGLEALWLWVTGETPGAFRVLSLALTAVGGLIVGAAGIAWRPIWRLQPWLERKTFPDLSGIWEGHLVSSYTASGEAPTGPNIPVTIVIRQGLFAVSVKLRSGESTSHSTRCLLEADREAGRFRLWYSYDNQPRARFAHRSARHEGVAWLEMDIDEDPERLAGLYYTNRKTNGEIDVRRTSRLLNDRPPRLSAGLQG